MTLLEFTELLKAKICEHHYSRHYCNSEIGHREVFDLIDQALAEAYLTPGDDETMIQTSPTKRSNQPCIRDLRLTVKDIQEYLASGMSVDEILMAFPDLRREDFFDIQRHIYYTSGLDIEL